MRCEPRTARAPVAVPSSSTPACASKRAITSPSPCEARVGTGPRRGAISFLPHRRGALKHARLSCCGEMIVIVVRPMLAKITNLCAALAPISKTAKDLRLSADGHNKVKAAGFLSAGNRHGCHLLAAQKLRLHQ